MALNCEVTAMGIQKQNVQNASTQESTNMTNHSQSTSMNQVSPSTATIAAISPMAQEALKKRGIDPQFAAQLGWKTSKERGNGEWIEIPYLVDGKRVNRKYRTVVGDKQFSQDAGGVKCLYNAQVIRQWQNSPDDLLIFEGEMDCIIAMQLGYMAVSVPDGAPAKELSEDTVKYDYLEKFPSKGTVVICADGDDAGANLLNDIAMRLGRHRCKWIRYPEGCKDMNEVFMRYGENGVKKTLSTAQFMRTDGVYKMSELPPVTEAETRTLSFIPLTFRKRDLSVVTGIPSHGKSTFMNYVCHDLAKQGWVVAYASFEQDPQTDHKDNLRSLTIGMSGMSVLEADDIIDKRYRFILPDIEQDEDVPLGWLLEKMAMAVFQHSVDMIVIDPWNEMDHSFDHREMTLTGYTGFAIKQLKKFGKRYNVHVNVVAHPTKQQKKNDGTYGVPALYDVSDSSHWYNKPELGMVIYLNPDGTTKCRVAKARHHKKIGKPGDYEFQFDPGTQEFSPVDNSDAVYSAYEGKDG